MKRILPIVVALAFAAFAAFGIVRWSKNQIPNEQSMDLVVASRTLAPDTTIGSNDIMVQRFSTPMTSQSAPGRWAVLLEDMVTRENISALYGRRILREIKQGEPINEGKLQPTIEKIQIEDWKNRIPEGKRAISIPIQAVNAVSGLIRVGDRVDVLVTLPVPREKEKADSNAPAAPMNIGTGANKFFMNAPAKQDDTEDKTFYLMQDVEVLTVGTETVLEEVKAGLDLNPFVNLKTNAAKADAITVAVAPDDALVFAHAVSSQSARFTLTLRTGGDNEVIDVSRFKPASSKDILEKVGYRE